MARKAGKVKARKLGGRDVPDGWEVVEEEVKEKTPKSESTISNKWLWMIFILVLAGFIAAGLMGRAPAKARQSVVVNGITIEATGDPIAAVKAIADRHTEGRTLDTSDDSLNALYEIGTVIGKTKVTTRGGENTLSVGITDRTGIFIGSKAATIEGKTRADLWTAVWTFNSIIAGVEIESSVPLFEIQDQLQWRQSASLVIDLDGACSSYGKIISASSDLMQSLGFWQASENYTIYQYNESNDACWLQFSAPSSEANFTTHPAACPVADSGNFVVVIRAAETNKIIASKDSLVYLYAGCEPMVKNSVIARDMLAPDILTGTRKLEMPTEI
jgi:hypothetical protein